MGVGKYSFIITFSMVTPFPQERTSLILHAGRLENTLHTSEDTERYKNLYFESIGDKDSINISLLIS